MNKGKLIVFEGVDGSGKSTQASLLENCLKEKEYKVLRLREPGGTIVGEKLRDIILDKDNANISYMTECYLYAAARCQLVDEIIIPALNQGKIIICDRFLYSSISYQGYGRKLGEQTVLDINKHAIKDIKSDLTVFFDMPIQQDRLSAEKDRMELNTDEFFENVYKGYKNQYNNKNTMVVNARDTIDNIFNKISEKVFGLLNG